MMTGLPCYVAQRRPRCFFFEEVGEMAKLTPKGSALTYLELVGRKLAQMGYSIRAIIINHAVFVRIPRERLFVFACSVDCCVTLFYLWIIGLS